MGFDQDKTAHHFYLYPDGGAIDIQVRDAADTQDRDAIRSHLPHIASMFEGGIVVSCTNFSATAPNSSFNALARAMSEPAQ